MKAFRLAKAAIPVILTTILFLNIMVTAQPASFPHVVFGTVSESEGTPVQNAQVKITNLRTEEYLTDSTNDQGQYQIDLASLPGGYQSGDEITIEAKLGDLEGSRTIMISDGPNNQVDITINMVEETPFPAFIGIVLAFTAMALILSLKRR